MTQTKPWYKTIINVASATVTYYGYAEPGTATSSAKWLIQRMTVSGKTSTLEFADGDRNFDNIWDNFAIIPYS